MSATGRCLILPESKVGWRKQLLDRLEIKNWPDKRSQTKYCPKDETFRKKNIINWGEDRKKTEKGPNINQQFQEPKTENVRVGDYACESH